MTRRKSDPFCVYQYIGSTPLRRWKKKKLCVYRFMSIFPVLMHHFIIIYRNDIDHNRMLLSAILDFAGASPGTLLSRQYAGYRNRERNKYAYCILIGLGIHIITRSCDEKDCNNVYKCNCCVIYFVLFDSYMFMC